MEGFRFRYLAACVIVLSWTCLDVAAINLRQGPRPQQVRPGTTVTLTCDVDQKAGITVYWYRQETQEYVSHDRIIYSRLPADRRRRYSIIGDRMTDVFTLRIANVEIADDGTYQCGYADGIGRFNVLASAKLTVLISPSEESPMCYVNTITGDPKMRKVGDVVEMVCRTEGGNPIPDLIWFRGGEELEENEGRRFATLRQTLRPQDATLNYTCLMRGPLITTRRSCTLWPMETSPEVHIDPVVNPVTVGATATFTCTMMTSTRAGVGVRGYSWTLDNASERALRSSPGAMQLSDNDRVLEIQNIQMEDDNTVVTCQAQTTSGELLINTATLVVVVEPTSMTTALTDMTTDLRLNVDAAHTDGSSWNRAMRPTSRSDFDNADADGSNGSTDVGVTVGMKAKIPAFLTGRTFIMTSAGGGAFLLIIIIVVIVVFKVVRRRNLKKMPITTQVLVTEHGNANDTYATILEMKRSTGSTYKGSATLPALKSERKSGLADIMRGGSSLSLTARSASLKGGDVSERSPLYAKPDKLRNSRPGLFSRESKNNSLDEVVDEATEETLYPDLEKEISLEQSMSATSTLSNRDLNAEGLIYADLVLNENAEQEGLKTATGKKTQYAKIVPSGKPRTSL